MASDDEDNGHFIIEDLHMAGLRGDDESDMEVERELVFGSSVFAKVIDVDGAIGQAAAGDGAAGAVPASADAGAADAITGDRDRFKKGPKMD
ncbi:unnamed protein product [Urochloa humidicola]